MPAAFEEIDGVDVVRVDDARSAQAAHNLGEDIARDLAPREVTERSKCDSDSGINVPARNAARNPYAEGGAFEGNSHSKHMLSIEALSTHQLPTRN